MYGDWRRINNAHKKGADELEEFSWLMILR